MTYVFILTFAILGVIYFFKLKELDRKIDFYSKKNKSALQGSWQTHYYDDPFKIKMTCIVCCEDALCDGLGYLQPSRYCPHCGSWMCDDEGNVLVDP